jgi:dipeptidyl aminopeptidase/acylaminoacyl peptidase
MPNLGPKIASVALVSVCVLVHAASSPDGREITDPKFINSISNPAAAPVPIAELYYTRSVDGAAWSPDDRQIAFTTNLTGRMNIWKVASLGGWPIQLAESDDRQFKPAWSPDGKWIVYMQDAGGGEMYDLYAVPSDGGDAINLTNTPEISEVDPRWSPDGESIAFASRPKDSSNYDIALLEWKSRRERKLTDEQTKNREWGGAVWSLDSKTIYANRSNAGHTDSDVYRIDVSSGRLENLTPHTGEINYSVSSVSPDGRTLLVTSNEKGGYDNIALLDLASKKLTWVTNLQWEAEAGGFSPDGKAFTYMVNEDGRTDLYIANRDIANRASVKAEKLALPTGINFSSATPRAYSVSGDRLLVAHQSSTQPEDYWIYDLHRRQIHQITFSALGGLNPERLPASQLVHYRTFDDKTISAFLWVPFNLKRDGSNPGVVIPHGGPTWQISDSFNKTALALASRGYVCVAPNVRGSTGYGMEFQKANYKDLGGGDLQDEVYAAKFLVATGFVDAKKIGITGGSYGGYMAMMAIGKTPDVWAAAVELYGITDWLSEQQHEEPTLQQYDQSLLGDPVKDRQVYENASPIKYFKNAKAPLLVLQGANDIRDPSEEAEQAVTILKQAGKVVDAHYYPGEGHGFAKRENQIDALKRTVEWFDRYLKNQN